MSELSKIENTFYTEISELLKQARNIAYKAVNTVMVQTDFDQFATHCVANLSWSNIRLIMKNL